MITRDFHLHPFGQPGRTDGNLISGSITRHEELLTIFYELSGDVDLIQIPKPVEKPARRHLLWEHTCFELFLKKKEVNEYLEFNLSPSGNWNIYRFDDYRKGMAEAPIVSEFPFTVKRKPNALEIKLEIHLDKIFPPNLTIAAGISAVIKTRDDNITYWALAHPAPKPDFHHPDSFVFEL